MTSWSAAWRTVPFTATFTLGAKLALVKVLDDLSDVNALISVTVWGRIGSWVGEAAEHRKMAKEALAGRADATADRLRRHIEMFQRRVFQALDAR